MTSKIDLIKIQKTVSSTIDELIKEMNGTVLIATDKEIIYKNRFGYANRTKKIPISMDTQFLIGSVTKQFTAVAILKVLFDKHNKNGIDISNISQNIQTDLNNPISNYLSSEHEIWQGSIPAWANQVTLHQLLVHSSGITNYTSLPDFDQQEFATPADLITFFKNHDLEFSPGEKFSYSNSGYYLLGILIQEIAEQNLDVYLEETFFKPLGMQSTFLPIDDTADNLIITDRRFLNLARGYQYEIAKENALLEELKRYDSMNKPGAAGGLISTASDLLKWNIALYNKKIIPRFLLEEMLNPYLLLLLIKLH